MAKGGLSFEGGLDASGLRIAAVVARFNAHITGTLLEGCREELRAHGLPDDAFMSLEVPGCFELPLAAKTLAATKRYDAVICLGAVIRGETPHFEYVSSAAALGLQQAALETGVPLIFGVLTTDTEQQARDRAGGAAGHKGREAALTAIEMAHRMREMRGD